MEEKFGYIYITTNLINGKIYVGQHKAKKFDKSYYGSGSLLKKAFKKYGKENFVTEILEWCSSYEELNEKEKYWIALKDSMCNEKGYNLDAGGKNSSPSLEARKKISKNLKLHYRGFQKVDFLEDGDEIFNSIDDETLKFEIFKNGHPTTRKEREAIKAKVKKERAYFYGRKHTEETKKKISEHEKGKIIPEESLKIMGEASKRNAKNNPNYGMRGKHHGEEAKKKISAYQLENNPNRGKSPSKETREKISIANTGKKRTDEFKEICRKRMTGRYVSEKTREKLREINMGRIITEEARQKIGLANRGRTMSDDFKKHISEANKGNKWITNGKDNIMVHKKDIDNYKSYFEQGWYFGFTSPTPIIHSEETKEKIRQNKIGTKMIHKEGIQKYVKTEEIEKWLNDGWELGKASKQKEGVK